MRKRGDKYDRRDQQSQSLQSAFSNKKGHNITRELVVSCKNIRSAILCNKERIMANITHD